MLRLESTRLGLTSSDIVDFEESLTYRRHPRVSQPHFRLSRGPNHQPRTAIVHQEQNVGRTRAASCSSEATICDLHGGESSPTTAKICSLPDRTRVISPIQPRNTTSNETTEHAEKEDNSVKESLDNIPARPTGGLSGTGVSRDTVLCPHENPASSATLTLDGTHDFEHGFIDRTLNPMSPPPFSSARARRRYGRSQDAPIFNDAITLQRYIEARHLERPRPSRQQFDYGIPHLVPELLLPRHGEIIHLPPSGTLDPSAAVFVPRTRFVSAARSTTGSSQSGNEFANTVRRPQRRNLRTSHSISDLRIRHPSEQNIYHASRLRRQLQGETQDLRQRERSRTSDQNIALTPPVFNINRLPIGSSLAEEDPVLNTNEAFQQPPQAPRLRPTPDPSTLSTSNQPALTSSAFHTPVRAVYSIRFNGSSQPNGLRAVSSVSSLISSSSTNFSLPFYSTVQGHNNSRSQSPLNQDMSSKLHRNALSPPKEVNLPNRATSSTRPLSTESLESTAKLLCMPNSPLDDLAEMLRRYSVARAPSGHSCRRLSTGKREKVSLLTGDLFHHESSPNSRDSALVPPIAGQTTKDTVHINDRAMEALTGVPIICQSGTPEADMTSSVFPSTPPACNELGSKARSPLANISPGKSTLSPSHVVPTRRVLVNSTAATPRMRVYDDTLPSSMLPQTPADIHASTLRRGRGRSETDYQAPSPPSICRSKMRSPPVIPPRNPHRNTYPVTTASSHSQQQHHQQQLHTQSSPLEATSSPTSSHGSAWRDRLPRRAEALRSSASESVENDIDGHVDALEEDRRTWLARRENGSLDTTPPKEGRFERYLS